MCFTIWHPICTNSRVAFLKLCAFESPGTLALKEFSWSSYYVRCTNSKPKKLNTDAVY